MRRPCRTQDPRLSVFSRSVVAGANPADEIAVGVELTNPAAAAIAAIVVAVIAGGDRAADHGGADETGSDAPAEALGFGLGGAGGDAAGNGKSSEGKRGNSGLDRHRKLYPVERGPWWSACPLDGALSKPVRIAPRKYGFVDYFSAITV